jgi:hypothetical protein
MRNIAPPRTIIFVSAIALGCVSVTADALAKSGVGGAGGHSVGHTASRGGIASGHASTASHGAPFGSASQGHAVDGSAFMHVGQGFVAD